jgi:RimJ/RimL family protein N-acetyltransferase
MSSTHQLAISVPELETARLRLRGHRSDDYPDCCAMWADAVVTRHIGGRAFTPEEVWARMLRYAGLWALLGYGYWALEEKSSGRFVGELGFADFRRDMDPPLEAPEVGWALASSVHGRGFATEALTSVLAWGDATLAIKNTVCIITPENIASINVAQKCGFRELRAVQYKATPVVVYKRLRPQPGA